jgi:hypothetical protein
VTYEDQHAEYLLMWNSPPYQNFEAVFYSGERLLYKVGGEEMVIRTVEGREITVCSHLQKIEDAGVARLVEKATEGLMECLRREKAMKPK